MLSLGSQIVDDVEGRRTLLRNAAKFACLLLVNKLVFHEALLKNTRDVSIRRKHRLLNDSKACVQDSEHYQLLDECTTLRGLPTSYVFCRLLTFLCFKPWLNGAYSKKPCFK